MLCRRRSTTSIMICRSWRTLASRSSCSASCSLAFSLARASLRRSLRPGPRSATRPSYSLRPDMAADSGENAASACMTACACRLLLATQAGVVDPACVEACASVAWAMAYTGVASAKAMAIARRGFIDSIHRIRNRDPTPVAGDRAMTWSAKLQRSWGSAAEELTGAVIPAFAGMTIYAMDDFAAVLLKTIYGDLVSGNKSTGSVGSERIRSIASQRCCGVLPAASTCSRTRSMPRP